MVEPDKPLKNLTPRMDECFWLLYQYQKENMLVGMTLAKIGEGLNLKSRSGVCRLVASLVDRGYIVERQQHRWRSLRLSARAMRIGRKRDREKPDG